MARMRDTDQRLLELEQQVHELSGDLKVLRSLVEQDHASALNKIRYVTEKVLHGLCTRHDVSWGAKEPTLENMIGPLIAAKTIPKNVAVHVRTIQTNASPGSHFQADALSSTHVQVAQMALLDLLEWHYLDTARASSAAMPRASASVVRPIPLQRRRPWQIAGGVLVIVFAAGGWYLLRRHDDEPTAAASLRVPAAGLDAIARYEQPRGEAEELGSESLWRTAAEDFASAAGQPDAPLRWRAGEHLARGLLALTRGELEGATEALGAAIAVDKSWPTPHAALADALSRLDRFDDAMRAAREAQRLEPKVWIWVVVGARVLRSANKLDEAIREYRRALSIAPREAALVAELSLVYHAAHLDAEAERHARDALAMDGNLVAPRIVLAERALEAGDGKTALAEATRALSVLPDSVSALLALGDAHALQERWSEAQAAYEKGIAAWHAHKSKGAAEARIASIERQLAQRVAQAQELVVTFERSRADAASAQDAASYRAAVEKLRALQQVREAQKGKLKVDATGRATGDRKSCHCAAGDPLCSCL